MMRLRILNLMMRMLRSMLMNSKEELIRELTLLLVRFQGFH